MFWKWGCQPWSSGVRCPPLLLLFLLLFFFFFFGGVLLLGVGVGDADHAVLCNEWTPSPKQTNKQKQKKQKKKHSHPMIFVLVRDPLWWLALSSNNFCCFFVLHHAGERKPSRTCAPGRLGGQPHVPQDGWPPKRPPDEPDLWVRELDGHHSGQEGQGYATWFKSGLQGLCTYPFSYSSAWVSESLKKKNWARNRKVTLIAPPPPPSA